MSWPNCYTTHDLLGEPEMHALSFILGVTILIKTVYIYGSSFHQSLKLFYHLHLQAIQFYAAHSITIIFCDFNILPIDS